MALEGEDPKNPKDELTFDYLRGTRGRVLRHREIDGATNTDREPVYDRLGSVMHICDADTASMADSGTTHGYTFDAW
jgi:hypothetical protein